MLSHDAIRELRRLSGDQSDYEPPQGIGLAAYPVRERGNPLVEGAGPCRAVLLGPCVLESQCIETIHDGSVQFRIRQAADWLAGCRGRHLPLTCPRLFNTHRRQPSPTLVSGPEPQP